MLAVPKVRAGKAPQLPRLISVGIDRTGAYQKFIFAKSVFGLALLPPRDGARSSPDLQSGDSLDGYKGYRPWEENAGTGNLALRHGLDSQDYDT